MPAIEFAENNLSYISINVILYLHTYQIMHASLKILSAYIRRMQLKLMFHLEQKIQDI